jgi:trehalose 6-phosphate synthase
VSTLPELTESERTAWIERARQPHLVLLLDLDGTLIPFADTVEEADIDSATAGLLDALATSGVQVVIASGRPRALVDRVRGRSPQAWWVAEHGTWRNFADQWDGPSAEPPELMSLAAKLQDLLRFTGLRLEIKSCSICIHWRRVSRETRDQVIDAAELICDEWLETHPQFERLEGVEVLEVRMRNANKSAAVNWVRERIPGAHVLAIGDDETDEDMFAALREDELAISVRNGNRRSARATHWLADPRAVHELLWWIVDARQRTPAAPPRVQLKQRVWGHPRSRLVVMSNRTPPTTTGRNRQVGGLVSALEPALRTREGIWLGWSGQTREGPPALAIDPDATPMRAAFDLKPAWRDRFYSGFCNRALWPLLHGFSERVRYSDEDWQAYEDVNRTFAQLATELATRDATIWVHDYHLFLVARALREAGHRGPVGLFLHVPFPSQDAIDTLPWADSLLGAMREFDIIGVHTEQWANNVIACLRAHDSRAGRPQRLPEVAVLPIGIDAENFAVDEGDFDPDIASLRAVLGERRLLLGVDRLDYAKGIPERLLAYEKLLERYPEWRTRVVLVQISVPSREDIPEYAELRQTVETLVGRINGKFGEAEWMPVRYLYRSYDHRILSQLYRSADVALVTPLRDGLNLVAKEFVAAQNPEAPGVLVLSKFAGAACELGDAILTNPYHPEGLAADLDRALRMPSAERIERQRNLRAAIEGSSPTTWAESFLGRLDAARS